MASNVPLKTVSALALAGVFSMLAAHAALLESLTYRQPRAVQQASLSAESIRRQIPQVAAAPVLDGRLTEACWQQAAAYLGSFRLGLSPIKARHSREAWACYDSRCLYLAVKLQRQPGQPLRVFTKGDDDGKIWEDDEIELFFDPFGTGSEYYQIILNSGGYLFDATHRYVTVLDPAGATPTDTKRENLMDTKWSSGLRRQIVVSDDYWTAELALPWASIGLAGAPAGHDLRFNVTSADWDTKEYTCLSPTSDWQDPLQFGTLVLGQPQVAVESLELADIGLGENCLRLKVRDLTGRGGRRLVNLDFDSTAARLRVQKTLDLSAGGTAALSVPFTVAARAGAWTARVTLTAPDGQTLFAARRAGEIPTPLLVRLGSQGVFTGGAPVPVSLSLGLGALSRSQVRVVAALTDAGGQRLAQQDLGTPATAELSALMPLDGLAPGVYRLRLTASQGRQELARSSVRLAVSASPYEP